MSEEPKDGEWLRVSTAGGKYTVIQGDSGRVRFLRDGLPWAPPYEELAFDLTLALAQDLEESRKSLEGERELYLRETRAKATLRDQFAIAALGGMLAHPECAGRTAEFAADAYACADAMMEERARGRTTP